MNNSRQRPIYCDERKHETGSLAVQFDVYKNS